MKAPEGMKWIDVTYEAERIDYERQDNVLRAEAVMPLLINERAAKWLIKGGPISTEYRWKLEKILQYRELLCSGKYVEGSIKDIRIMEDDE